MFCLSPSFADTTRREFAASNACQFSGEGGGGAFLNRTNKELRGKCGTIEIGEWKLVSEIEIAEYQLGVTGCHLTANQELKQRSILCTYTESH